MAESNSSSPSSPSVNSNRGSHSGKIPGHWHRIFKFAKKDKLRDGRLVAEDRETNPPLPKETDGSRQGHLGDRMRAKSLHSARSRIAVPPAPRSAKFFSFNARTHKRRFLKKSSTSDNRMKQVDIDEIHDAQQLFTESSPSPSSIVPSKEEAEIPPAIRRKRVSLKAIRHTKANLTMLFAKNDMLMSSHARSDLKRTKSETQSDLWLNSSTRKENDAIIQPRTRSLLDIGSLSSFKEGRLSSLFVLSNPCDTSVKTEVGDTGDQDTEVVSARSDGISSGSLEKSASEGSRIFSFRHLFWETGSQHRRGKSSHISLESSTDRYLQKPLKDESNRLLLRRSSSMPQDMHAGAGATKNASNLPRMRLASSDDGLQCPWGVKARNEESESLVVRNHATLNFRIADISSALHFPGKRVNSSSSESINLSDDDYEHTESDFNEKQKKEVEMQHDDFIEYTVKMAKKQRK